VDLATLVLSPSIISNYALGICKHFFLNQEVIPYISKRNTGIILKQQPAMKKTLLVFIRSKLKNIVETSNIYSRTLLSLSP